MSSVRVASLRAEDVDELGPLLSSARQARHRFVGRAAGESLGSHWLREIARVLDKGGGPVLAAYRDGAIAGLVAYEDLEWERRIFGRRMGVLSHIATRPADPGARETLAALLDRILEWAGTRGVEFLLCKTYADDSPTVHALQARGFLLMDTMLDYVYDARVFPLAAIPPPVERDDVIVRPAAAADLPALREVARAAFGPGYVGRFHADPRIPGHQAVRVYEEWIESACAGYADWVFLAESAGRILGYSVWRRPSAEESALPLRVGHYSIGAVHPEHSGRGLFARLTYAGMKVLEAETDCIEGPTHAGNVPVQQAYARLGWRVYDARHAFHRWG